MGDSLGLLDPSQWRHAPCDLVRSVVADALCLVPSKAQIGNVELYPHQVTGVGEIESIIARHGGALLADDVGMGKTFTALAVARPASCLLVVAPAALREMWGDALARCQRAATFVSFEQLSSGRAASITPDFVIVDEAHHVRNPRTRRYRALATLTRRARVLLLTATPLHNHEGDVRHALALFLGARAHRATPAELRACSVRRRGEDFLHSDAPLPSVHPTTWLPLPHRDDVADRLAQIPAPVAPSDGGEADALVALLLLRLWASSDAALRQALRRMWSRATALTSALQSGHFPHRRDLGAWVLHDDALQLAFAPLVAGEASDVPRGELLDRLAAHTDAVRGVLAALTDGPDVDSARVAHVLALASRESGGVVAFTQYAETARMLYRRLDQKSGVILLTAAGATCASGRLSRREVLAAAQPAHASSNDPRMPLRLLITTDLLSEGVNLSGLSHALHVDLPWTPARLSQRVGRLRRPNSPHRHIGVTAFELPAEAERVAGLIRTLQRKASMSRRWIDSDVLSGFPDAHAPHLHSPTGHPELDAAAALRRALIPWRSRGGSSAAGRSRPSAWDECSDSAQRGRAPVAFVTADVSDWAALLLIRVEGEPRLLLVTPDAVTDAIQDVVCQLHLFERSDATPQSTDRVARAVDAWLSHHVAHEAVCAGQAGDSHVHRTAFRLLAQIESALPRHERLRASPSLTTLRQRVAAVRGVGAEAVLANAVRAAASDADPRNAVRRLAAGTEECTTPASADAPRLLAGLIAVR